MGGAHRTKSSFEKVKKLLPAMTHVGIQRLEWSHPALQASFVNELIRRRKLYSVFLGPYFNRALQLRLDSDCRLKGVSQKQAT